LICGLSTGRDDEVRTACVEANTVRDERLVAD
jgi:hypothetical protein